MISNLLVEAETYSDYVIGSLDYTEDLQIVLKDEGSNALVRQIDRDMSLNTNKVRLAISGVNTDINDGSLVFMQHGLYSNSKEFEEMVKQMKNDGRFISLGIITARTDEGKNKIMFNDDFNQNIYDRIGKKIGLTTNMIAQMDTKDKVSFLTNTGINVLVRSEFSNPNGSHDEQINELAEFINMVRPSEQKVTLVGHSKGGIVSVGYASKFPYNHYVDKVITISTPYLANNMAKMAESSTGNLLGKSGAGTADLAGYTPTREILRDNWNKNGLADVYAIAIDLDGIGPVDGEGVVSMKSQRGGDFKGIVSYDILKDAINNRQSDTIGNFDKSEDGFPKYFHTNTPDQYDIIKLVKDIILGDI